MIDQELAELERRAAVLYAVAALVAAPRTTALMEQAASVRDLIPDLRQARVLFAGAVLSVLPLLSRLSSPETRERAAAEVYARFAGGTSDTTLDEMAVAIAEDHADAVLFTIMEGANA
jgi:hypothetical protein